MIRETRTVSGAITLESEPVDAWVYLLDKYVGLQDSSLVQYLITHTPNMSPQQFRDFLKMHVAGGFERRWEDVNTNWHDQKVEVALKEIVIQSLVSLSTSSQVSADKARRKKRFDDSRYYERIVSKTRLAKNYFDHCIY